MASPATCATPCRTPRSWASPARRSRRRTRTRDASTRAVFGDYISVYDIARAIEDGATVPIYYEGRPAKLELAEAERPRIDADFHEVTEGEEVERNEGQKSK